MVNILFVIFLLVFAIICVMQICMCIWEKWYIFNVPIITINNILILIPIAFQYIFIGLINRVYFIDLFAHFISQVSEMILTKQEAQQLPHFSLPQ